MLRASTLIAVTLFLALPLAGHAQSTGVDEITRQALRGNVGPYEGASYFERYHYGNIQPLGIWSSRSFYDLEYLDRLDRQEKFGSRWPSAKYGSEFQVERINREYIKRMDDLDKSRSRFSFSTGAFFGRVR
jgi:hypothetical protein